MADITTSAGLAALNAGTFRASHFELGNTTDRSTPAANISGVRSPYNPRRKLLIVNDEIDPESPTQRKYIAKDVSTDTYTDVTEIALLDSSDTCLAYFVRDAGAFSEKASGSVANYCLLYTSPSPRD